MTYFGFLLVFLAIPIAVLLIFQIRSGQNSGLLWGAIAAQIGLALLYTTPWDNHLVATGVWHYNPQLVTGVILGYVPLEEYVFFVLETLLTGLWLDFCSRHVRASGEFRPSKSLRLGSAGSVAVLWLVSTIVFFSGWKPGTYLFITLAWALPPIILQLAYGADILWHERRLVSAVVLPLGVYLSIADALAIRAGIWAISPAQSTGLFIGGLPMEEGFFFFVTVILIAFGITLTLSDESRKRLPLRNWQGARVATGSKQNAAQHGGEK